MAKIMKRRQTLAKIVVTQKTQRQLYHNISFDVAQIHP